jgi:aryl-alcohol dehydrogenase-like predicted oxidoreductase
LSAPAAPRLGLGTAQIGLPYGLAGRPLARESAAELLRVAWEEKVDLLDTAAAYGEAERLIGELRPPHARFAVVSKIGAPTEAGIPPAAQAVRAALARLRVARLDALLVHHAPHLLAPGGAERFAELERLKGEGLVGRLGVSVYDAATLKAVLDAYPIDIVQLPLNVLDQRLLRDGSLAALAARGIEVHARSVFLQGVLLAEPARLPTRLAQARAPVERFHARAAAAGLSAAAAALGFVARCAGVSRIVVGVDSASQLRANLAALREALAPGRAFDAAALAVEERAVVDPRSWGA